MYDPPAVAPSKYNGKRCVTLALIIKLSFVSLPSVTLSWKSTDVVAMFPFVITSCSVGDDVIVT